MNFKVVGMGISVIVIAVMVFIMVQTNFSKNDVPEELAEYPSANIADLPADAVDESLDYESGLKIDEKAPDFELLTLDGETVKLSDYKGKKVMLNFWASWCAPCRVEMPYMENYYQAYKDSENVEILAVNMTKMERGSRDKVGEFVEEHQLTFPILMDEDGDVMDLYKIMIYPTTYMINAEGIITNIVQTSIDEAYLKELVDDNN